MSVRRRTRAIRAVWTPSALRRFLRHRLVRAALAAALVAGAFALLGARMAAIEQERAGWGETAEVVVLTAPVQLGGILDGATETRLVPRGLVPPAAVDRLPPGARAKVPLHEGEIVLAPRVTDTEQSGLPAGSVALTLSIVQRVPLVEVGDLVDLWTVDGLSVSSRRVAERALVLALSDENVTVAVPEDDTADATAASLRPVTVVLVG